MRYKILDALRDFGEEHLKEKAKLWSWTDLGRLWVCDLHSCDLWQFCVADLWHIKTSDVFWVSVALSNRDWWWYLTSCFVEMRSLQNTKYTDWCVVGTQEIMLVLM